MGTNGGGLGSSLALAQTASETQPLPRCSNIHDTSTACACLNGIEGCPAEDCNFERDVSSTDNVNIGSGHGRQRLGIQSTASAGAGEVQADLTYSLPSCTLAFCTPATPPTSTSTRPAVPSSSNISAHPGLAPNSASVISGTDNQKSSQQQPCESNRQESSPTENSASECALPCVMDMEMNLSNANVRAGAVNAQDFPKNQNQQQQQQQQYTASQHFAHFYLRDNPPVTASPRRDLLAPQDRWIRRDSSRSISIVASLATSLSDQSIHNHAAGVERETKNIAHLSKDDNIKKLVPYVAPDVHVDDAGLLRTSRHHQGLVATVLNPQDSQTAQPAHQSPVNHRQLTRSQSLPSTRSSFSSISNSLSGHYPLVDTYAIVPGTLSPAAGVSLALPLQFTECQNNSLSTISSTQVRGLPPFEPLTVRPRRNSLLTPTQLKRMSEDTVTNKSNLSSTRNHKANEPKAKAKIRLKSVAKVPPTNTEQPPPHRPSARNTPTLTFQPHYTEISTDRPSVSGRLVLHIPKIRGKAFEFVSLTLTLRLKESIAWTRQDLTKFEIQKESWSQVAWEKTIPLHFQDKQVEEGEETVVSTKNNPVLAATSPSPKISTELPADEWRWEWLMPVTRDEVWPESFEGSMGMVWYEMEAKCHFRWVTDGHNDPADFVYTTDLQTSTKDRSKKVRSRPLPGSVKFKKGMVYIVNDTV